MDCWFGSLVRSRGVNLHSCNLGKDSKCTCGESVRVVFVFHFVYCMQNMGQALFIQSVLVLSEYDYRILLIVTPFCHCNFIFHGRCAFIVFKRIYAASEAECSFARVEKTKGS